MAIRVRKISTDDPLYPQACALREDVLLRSVGWDMGTYREMMPGREERAEHYVATVSPSSPAGAGPAERVIACGCLIPPEDGEDPPAGKVTQVCVDRQRQGEGVGRRLLTTIEARAFGELGLPQLYCHSQLEAIPFYERLGWRQTGAEFQEAGIPHRRLELVEPSGATPPADL